ncbi:unnamed protein product [Ambrosiozyma monospora]|uniref:Unnamed protein product n=1 Tax=Ambrosiozyma monospora TaxID=43982 RepID=A0ACB5TGC6_AMBMO|nr:unnamed protein product [Ambrosiozyma monospora]
MSTTVSYPPVQAISRKRKRSGTSATSTVSIKRTRNRGQGKVATRKLLKQLPTDIILTIYQHTLQSHLSFYELFSYVGNDKNYDSVVRLLLTNNDIQISQTSMFIVVCLKSITEQRPEIREYSCLYKSHDSRSVIRKFMKFIQDHNVQFRTVEMDDGLCCEDRDLLLSHCTAVVAKDIRFVGGEKLHVDQLKKFASILDVTEVVNGEPKQLQQPQQQQRQPASMPSSSSVPFLSDSNVPSYIHESINKSKGIVFQRYNQFTFTTAQLFSTLCEYGKFQNLKTITVSIICSFDNMNKLNPVFQSPNFKRLAVVISTYPNLNNNNNNTSSQFQIGSSQVDSNPSSRIQDRLVDSLHKFKTFQKKLEIHIDGNFNIIPNSNQPRSSRTQLPSHSQSQSLPQLQTSTATFTHTSSSQTPKFMLSWLHILKDFWSDIKSIRSSVLEMDCELETWLSIINYRLVGLNRLELCVVFDDEHAGVPVPSLIIIILLHINIPVLKS